jgi:hypothetical protein
VFSTTQTQNPAQIQSNPHYHHHLHTAKIHKPSSAAKIATKPVSLSALTPQTQDLYGLDHNTHTLPHARVRTKPVTHTWVHQDLESESESESKP